MALRDLQMPLVPRTLSSASHVCVQHRAWHRGSDAAHLCTAPIPPGTMPSSGAHAAEGPASPPLGQQDVVHASQLDVDLQAEVGQGLWCGPLHVLHLHTLCGHPQHRVPHALDLGCGARKTHTLAALPSTSSPARPSGPPPRNYRGPPGGTTAATGSGFSARALGGHACGGGRPAGRQKTVSGTSCRGYGQSQAGMGGSALLTRKAAFYHGARGYEQEPESLNIKTWHPRNPQHM